MACVRRWRGAWCVDFRDGSGKRIIQRAESKQEAQEKLAEIMRGLKVGSYDPTLAKTHLEEYAPKWLQMKQAEVKPSTLTSYEYALRVHILPDLGKHQLGKLTREAIKAFLGKKNESGLSRDTVRVLHATLRALLEEAVESGIVPVNVARRAGKFVKGKADRGEKIQFFSRDELALFLETAKTEALAYYPLFLCLARTGLRIGEAIGLQCGDLDFAGFGIEVRRNIVKGRVGTPKNGRTRRVDMSQQLAQVLRGEIANRKAQLLRLGKSADELGNLWLFQSGAGGPLDDSKVRKVLARLLVKAGLPRRNLHSLRHSFASLLIQNGESLAYVRDQLGHSSIQITVDTYGHLVPGGNRRAVNRLDDGNKVETFEGISAHAGQRREV